GSALTLNLDYMIPAAKSSSSDILGKPAGTYTQTVTYTATAL
ncbi:peptidoglycan-binding protein LysM, partial [Chryseobacterium formosus]|nr:peptidoglycan-binding protein LysM [Chryseobacterium formosus]